MGPQVSIDLGRIERNARAVVARCAQSGIRVFGVTKGACGMPHVARAMLRGGVHGLAESRFENIRRLQESGIDCPIMLLRSPPFARVEEVVRTVDISLQSELATIAEISRIAGRLGRVHDIILMIDLGDLREGIWPTDIVPTVEAVLKMPGVRIAGVGTNLTCFGAIMPTPENLGQLVAHAYKVESLIGRPLEWISGGNSSSLPLLLEGSLPAGINNLRIGEAILQGGIETFRDEPWRELEFDAFQLTADLIEVKVKPSVPIGESGYDAFGNQPEFSDEGDRLRAIANVGREDVMIDGLAPLQNGVRVLGASSDHLVLDVTDADPRPQVGDRVGFRMGYGAMLLAMTSEYVEKTPLHDAGGIAGRRQVAIAADSVSAPLIARADLGSRLEAVGFDVVELGDASRAPAGLVRLTCGGDRRRTLDALRATASSAHSFGLIWIDSVAGLASGEAATDGRDVLAVALGLAGQAASVQPQLSPENVALVGLREAAPAEVERLKASRVTAFTMSEIDATGMRQVMREAIRIASAGTRGFHVAYSPTATEMPGWPGGSGGMTVRETHLAFEQIALSQRMISMDVAPLDQTLGQQAVAETLSFVLSAFGKRIL